MAGEKKAPVKAAAKAEKAPKAAPVAAAAHAPSESVDERGSRRTMEGVVTSDKMDKTVVVVVHRRIRSGQYHKYLTKQVKYKAHSANNEYKTGDKVLLVESRPLSKDKRWRVEKLLVKAKNA
jgi:small subunit ribosomal protein S17